MGWPAPPFVAGALLLLVVASRSRRVASNLWRAVDSRAPVKVFPGVC